MNKYCLRFFSVFTQQQGLLHLKKLNEKNFKKKRVGMYTARKEIQHKEHPPTWIIFRHMKCFT